MNSGYFWQGNFGPVAVDSSHVEATHRYVPLKGRDDGLTNAKAVKDQFGPLRPLLGEMPDMDMLELALRRAETIGRPLGCPAFLDKLEHKLDRTLKPAKRGPKPKTQSDKSELSS